MIVEVVFSCYLHPVLLILIALMQGMFFTKAINGIQAFVNFRGYDFRDFQFKVVYNSSIFSSPLVLLKPYLFAHPNPTNAIIS